MPLPYNHTRLLASRAQARLPSCMHMGDEGLGITHCSAWHLTLRRAVLCMLQRSAGAATAQTHRSIHLLSAHLSAPPLQPLGSGLFQVSLICLIFFDRWRRYPFLFRPMVFLQTIRQIPFYRWLCRRPFRSSCLRCCTHPPE